MPRVLPQRSYASRADVYSRGSLVELAALARDVAEERPRHDGPAVVGTASRARPGRGGSPAASWSPRPYAATPAASRPAAPGLVAEVRFVDEPRQGRRRDGRIDQQAPVVAAPAERGGQPGGRASGSPPAARRVVERHAQVGAGLPELAARSAVSACVPMVASHDAGELGEPGRVPVPGRRAVALLAPAARRRTRAGSSASRTARRRRGPRRTGGPGSCPAATRGHRAGRARRTRRPRPRWVHSPGKTDSRRKTARSRSGSRSWLHAIAVRRSR